MRETRRAQDLAQVRDRRRSSCAAAHAQRGATHRSRAAARSESGGTRTAWRYKALARAAARSGRSGTRPARSYISLSSSGPLKARRQTLGVASYITLELRPPRRSRPIRRHLVAACIINRVTTSVTPDPPPSHGGVYHRSRDHVDHARSAAISWRHVL